MQVEEAEATQKHAEIPSASGGPPPQAAGRRGTRGRRTSSAAAGLGLAAFALAAGLRHLGAGHYRGRATSVGPPAHPPVSGGRECVGPSGPRTLERANAHADISKGSTARKRRTKATPRTARGPWRQVPACSFPPLPSTTTSCTRGCSRGGSSRADPQRRADNVLRTMQATTTP